MITLIRYKFKDLKVFISFLTVAAVCDAVARACDPVGTAHEPINTVYM